MTGMELGEYLSRGTERIVKGIVKASVSDPGAGLFIIGHLAAGKRAAEKRKQAEAEGEHIPPFLIASITEQCNLHCKGCYAWANHSCTDECREDAAGLTLSTAGGGARPGETAGGLLSAEDWGKVFEQAGEMGVEFILLAGGEPFLRRDVLVQAGGHSNLLFPIFTNGTMIDGEYLKLLKQCRNLMPVISLEGNRETTDLRRGNGVYRKLEDAMEQLHKNGILFGVSVTVTKQNLEEVLADSFLTSLKTMGVKAVVFVEYVPVGTEGRELAPDDAERARMLQRLEELRDTQTELILIAFPGDEKALGGCLAAGRGFFHINARGGAEPCPFSPYSDTNVKDVPLGDVLHSPLFCRLQENGNLTEEHEGGCVLFEQREQVARLVQE